VIAAQHVAELVLIAELLVPVGVKKEVVGARARPPRFLEIVVEIGVAADECGTDTGAHRIQLAPRQRARWIGKRNHRIATSAALDAVGDDHRVRHIRRFRWARWENLRARNSADSAPKNGER
jgi:hypothetical protein